MGPFQVSQDAHMLIATKHPMGTQEHTSVGCSRDPCPVFCWPPWQRLPDRADLGAHHETILPAQPFPLTQFMLGIKISLGSSLTAANICIELEEREDGEDWGNAARPLPAKLKLQLAPQPGPEHLSSHLPSSCRSGGKKHHYK